MGLLLLNCVHIIYVDANNGSVCFIYSPTGSALRTIRDIKEYLLTAGTCKCGLPCPFRPEMFFNFDSQVRFAVTKLLIYFVNRIVEETITSHG